MAENLIISTSSDKTEKYKTLIPQMEALVKGENDIIANLANIAAALKETFDFFWVGFYIVKGNELVLGPFQGPIACTRIAKGRGVCGAAWEKAGAILVPDVDKFPGHIACNSASRSEIVVPIIRNGEVAFVLDVDSDQFGNFNSIDEEYLGRIAELIAKLAF